MADRVAFPTPPSVDLIDARGRMSKAWHLFFLRVGEASGAFAGASVGDLANQIAALQTQITTLQGEIDTLESALVAQQIKVGGYYITTDSADPATTLGYGTWERIKGRFLVGVDESDADWDVVNETGGSKTATL